MAFDNALWHDRVADPSQRDPETVAVRELGRTVLEHDALVPALLSSYVETVDLVLHIGMASGRAHYSLERLAVDDAGFTYARWTRTR